MALTASQMARYARHLSLQEFGEAKQKQLLDASVLCIGAGGLGCPVLLYLAAAGIGRLGIADADTVSLSNLQRQVLFTESDLNKNKAECAKQHVLARNSKVHVEVFDFDIHEQNALDTLGSFDVIVDCSDNFATRYVLNDACCQLGKPLVAASILGFKGQVSVYAGENGPCYRCLFPTTPTNVPSCSEAGVLGVLPGVMGTVQATEVIKCLLGLGDTLQGVVLQYDALNMKFERFSLQADPDCLACQKRLDFDALVRPARECATAVASSGLQGTSENSQDNIDVLTLKSWQDQNKAFLLLDVREPYEYHICNLGGMLVPLAQLPGMLDQLDPQQTVAVLCRTGHRSQQAMQFLRSHGFEQVFNVAGGIHAWSDSVDASVVKY